MIKHVIRSPHISAAEPEVVVVALYLRDAYRLPVDSDVPRLSPRVNVQSRPAHLDEHEACREWNDFWNNVSRDETTRVLAQRKHALIEQSEFPIFAGVSTPIQADMIAYAAMRK